LDGFRVLLLALNGFLMLLPSQFGLLKPDDLLVILRALHGFLELFLAFDGIDVHFGVGRPAARISFGALPLKACGRRGGRASGLIVDLRSNTGSRSVSEAAWTRGEGGAHFPFRAVFHECYRFYAPVLERGEGDARAFAPI
jgi:hypothetical protein